MKKLSLGMIAFIQACGLGIYIGLVALLMANGNQWFGQLQSYSGPLLFLTLFVFSAAACGLIYLGYPFRLFWIDKQTSKAIQLVLYTTGWLFAFLVVLLAVVITR